MLTVTAARAALAARGVDAAERTIRKWCASGYLKAQRIGGKQRATWLIDRSDLDAFTPPNPKGGRPARPTPPEGGRAEGE